jgi:hypothetical protein
VSGIELGEGKSNLRPRSEREQSEDVRTADFGALLWTIPVLSLPPTRRERIQTSSIPLRACVVEAKLRINRHYAPRHVYQYDGMQRRRGQAGHETLPPPTATVFDNSPIRPPQRASWSWDAAATDGNRIRHLPIRPPNRQAGHGTLPLPTATVFDISPYVLPTSRRY